MRDASAALEAHGLSPQTVVWLEPRAALDIYCSAGDRAALESVRAALAPQRDLCLQAVATRKKRLLLTDMDATMVNAECLDELAAANGLGERVAQITEQAMRGALDFESALHERVALLVTAGANVQCVQQVLRERVRLNPGARTLLATLRRHGVRTVLVSGGFDVFVEPVARELGFSEWRCNRFVLDAGKIVAVQTPIMGAQAKLAALLEHRHALGIASTEVVAVGDGANDIPMLAAAGLGVAWRAKPKVQVVIDCWIDTGPLSTILHFLGIPRAEWIEPLEGAEVRAQF